MILYSHMRNRLLVTCMESIKTNVSHFQSVVITAIDVPRAR